MTTDVDAASAMPQQQGRRLAGVARKLRAALAGYLERRRTRRGLSELTECQLRDIGVTRAEANVEVSRSWFWQ